MLENYFKINLCEMYMYQLMTVQNSFLCLILINIPKYNCNADSVEEKKITYVCFFYHFKK